MAVVWKVVRFSISILLALLTLEMAARLDDYLRFGADFLDYYGPKALLTLDAGGLTQNRPLVQFEKWRHDDRGFRLYPGIVESGYSTRWACVGSSESYGLYERPGGEWPALLGAELAPTVRVDNASVVGISPFELTHYLDEHVLPSRPDLVIVVISPFAFTLAVDSGASADAAHFADPARITRMAKYRAPSLTEHLRFLAKAKASALRRLTPDQTRHLAIAMKQRKLARLERAGKRPAALLNAPSAAAIVKYREVLAGIESQLASQGVGLAICTYPNFLRSDDSLAMRDAMLDRTLWLPAYSPTGLLAISAEFSQATRDFCATSGAILIDLETAIPKDTDHFADSVHLTDTGAVLVATSVRNALVGRLEPLTVFAERFP